MEMVKVFLIDLPAAVYGFTTYYFDEDGQAYYTIFINTKMNVEKQVETYRHEVAHIDSGDFGSMRKVDEIEYYRHDIA